MFPRRRAAKPLHNLTTEVDTHLPSSFDSALLVEPRRAQVPRRNKCPTPGHRPTSARRRARLGGQGSTIIIDLLLYKQFHKEEKQTDCKR